MDPNMFDGVALIFGVAVHAVLLVVALLIGIALTAADFPAWVFAPLAVAAILIGAVIYREVMG